MRLEGHHHAAAVGDVTRGPQHADEFGRVVGVVVDHPDAARGALGLEAAAGTGEPGEPLQQAGGGQAELQPGGERPGGVA